MNISISNHTLINFIYRDYRLIKKRQEGCISQHHLPILLRRGKGGVQDVDGQNTVCLSFIRYSMFRLGTVYQCIRINVQKLEKGMLRLVFWQHLAAKIVLFAVINPSEPDVCRGGFFLLPYNE
jgi:hypothetical protein